MKTEIEWNFDMSKMPDEAECFTVHKDGGLYVSIPGRFKDSSQMVAWAEIDSVVKVVHKAAMEARKPKLPDWAAPHVTLDGWRSGSNAKRICINGCQVDAHEVAVYDDGEIHVNGRKVISYEGEGLRSIAIKVAERIYMALAGVDETP